MKSTTIFSGNEHEIYMYDVQNKYLLNSHPLLELFEEHHHESIEKKRDLAKEKYPDLPDNEISYYFNKYQYLKSNGFFSEINTSDLLSGKVSSSMIEEHLTDLDHVVFQVTGDCNLKCKYCCFGDLYEGIPINKKAMDMDLVKNVFDFLIPYWNSKRNSSYKNVIGIGFYGGEPLLNFALIQQIVSYCTMLQLDNNAQFVYSMTTNALLLDKHIDYLYEHDFSILVSLDGNEIHDSYRIDNNNQPSFSRVYKNLKFVQSNYSTYFEKKIQVNSVLTNKATVSEIHNFIYSSFLKTPLIEPVSTVGLKKSELDEFEQIRQNYDEDVELIQKRTIFSSVGKELSYFFYYNLNNSYRHYSDLLTSDNMLPRRIPTGTCFPFWKKMYITSDGNIMACERIGLDHVLGRINASGVSVDFQSIANTYNEYFSTIKEQCINCYHANACSRCIFQTEFEGNNPKCPNVITKHDFKLYLKHLIGLLESKPDLFFQINKTVFA